MPNRYRLKGASLEEIRRKAEQLYGPAARIVSAERVSSPGIAGLFAQDRYEAMIELQSRHEVVTGEVVPDADILADSDPITGGPAGETAAGPASAGTVPGAGTPAGKYDAGAAAAASAPPVARTAGQAGTAGGPARPAAPSHHLQGAAIAALLEEADAAELSLHRPAPAGVSTESRDFAELLEQLGAGLRTPTEPPAAAVGAAAVGSAVQPAAAVLAGAAVQPAAVAPGSAVSAPAPAPLTGVGDLVLLVGLGEDAMDTALAMSMASGGADVRTAGELSAYGHLHVDGRQSATAARAHAVVTERTVLVAFGLGKARNALARVPSLAGLSADQVWVVVDAGRKHEDTARWVGVLTAQLNVTAVAVVGASETGSPESVNGLGLPVGWIDGRPSGPDPTWQNRREAYDAPRAEG
ncbi:hypothetical protein SAMN05660473_04018 [Arthrobacter sp. 49Tsu3.1M3]|uniref:hypothetical protein n=1 Tax=Arthrobacter sp. 49Tsu3.1M3 TaxID=1279029 RepID=UPI0009CE6712|nr:hypothetical protein [Arthrobacter sp. 49Tsu3.1M3]SKC08043.1 hypothetical protein SAMN05660473_04018 [Arthrobacter sp. 49Tsu3.1M3]